MGAASGSAWMILRSEQRDPSISRSKSVPAFSKKCCRRLPERFATDQTADLSSSGYDRKILKVWSKSVPTFSKKCCRRLPERFATDQTADLSSNWSKIERNSCALFWKQTNPDLLGSFNSDCHTWKSRTQFIPWKNVILALNATVKKHNFE